MSTMELYGSSGALESEGIHHAYLILQPYLGMIPLSKSIRNSTKYAGEMHKRTHLFSTVYEYSNYSARSYASAE